MSCVFCYDSSRYLIFNGMYSDVCPQYDVDILAR